MKSWSFPGNKLRTTKSASIKRTHLAFFLLHDLYTMYPALDWAASGQRCPHQIWICSAVGEYVERNKYVVLCCVAISFWMLSPLSHYVPPCHRQNQSQPPSTLSVGPLPSSLLARHSRAMEQTYFITGPAQPPPRVSGSEHGMPVFSFSFGGAVYIIRLMAQEIAGWGVSRGRHMDPDSYGLPQLWILVCKSFLASFFKTGFYIPIWYILYATKHP